LKTVDLPAEASVPKRMHRAVPFFFQTHISPASDRGFAGALREQSSGGPLADPPWQARVTRFQRGITFISDLAVYGVAD